ncbi:MAG: lipoyl synthase, partial [Candidatus Omnitrophica bacterium]|nr:lipoyl synthase [Candidatus Omnitrophota bacterium]
MPKPEWLNKKISLGDCRRTREMLGGLGLHTVCEEALCPNIGECFAAKQATFLIMGAVCTRSCSFCAVEHGRADPPDADEPRRVSAGIRRLGLRHAVITSVTRDDLPDGGAGMFVRTIRQIRLDNPHTAIEVLIPDFRGDRDAVAAVVAARPDIIAHNLETVPRLYLTARQGAEYKRSLDVLAMVKQMAPALFTKSGLMLGLGETEQEVCAVFRDLRQSGVDFLSLGQYLAPGRTHLPVAEYLHPERFLRYREQAVSLGFRRVISA